MNKLHIDTCPLCGGTHLKQAMTCTDAYATGERFDLYTCGGCGFTFTQDAPVEAEMGRYYATPDYISHSDTRKGLMNTVYHYVRSYMLGRKARLVMQMSRCRGGRILDIGTGTGYFAHAMDMRGWEVTAVEKSAEARAFAKKHFGLEALPETALPGLASASFDVVTLWHVMEHLEHLNETWERLHDLLTDKGTLIVAVPNPASYDASCYRENWAAYDVPRHLWHFTPDTMEQMADRHRFRLKATLPMPFDAFYVSMLSEKNMGHGNPFFKGMRMGIKAWGKSLNNPRLSSSIIYVFKKQ